MVDRGTFSNVMLDLAHVDDRIRSCAPLGEMTPLPDDFIPDSWSVICGRGKYAFNHTGNRRFRVLCHANLEKYSTCKSKMEKSLIVMSIVDAIREGSQNGGFIKKDASGRWVEVGDNVAREKVGQELRQMAAKTKPTKKAKQRLTAATPPNIQIPQSRLKMSPSSVPLDPSSVNQLFENIFGNGKSSIASCQETAALNSSF